MELGWNWLSACKGADHPCRAVTEIKGDRLARPALLAQPVPRQNRRTPSSSPHSHMSDQLTGASTPPPRTLPWAHTLEAPLDWQSATADGAAISPTAAEAVSSASVTCCRNFMSFP